MVLAYQEIDRPQHQIAKQLKVIARAGVPGSRLFRLASNSLEVDYRPGTMADLETALRQDVPPIALVFTSQLPYWNRSTPHAVVIIGMSQEQIFIHDPAHERPGIAVAHGDFHLACDEMGNRFALLQVK
jgi:hypothetical protein